MTDEFGWDPSLYDDSHTFVPEYGADLIDRLNPQDGDRILDLGCGTGQLTAEIADRGADVVGLDNSPAMIERARENYPELTFVEADARTATFDELFDGVLSNAALHWIPDAAAPVRTVRSALRPIGRFVAELGGTGNVQTIVDAIVAAPDDAGYDVSEHDPWYFPSVGEYATLLEDHDLEVTYATIFDRPIRLEGEEGLRNWLSMFAESFFEPVPEREREAVVRDVVDRLRPDLYGNGEWIADYRRLRVIARRGA